MDQLIPSLAALVASFKDCFDSVSVRVVNAAG